MTNPVWELQYESCLDYAPSASHPHVRMGLAISLVSTVPEKVWYHSNCPNRGKGCYNTQLVEKGGCAIWYNEPQVRNTRCKSEKWLWHDGYVNYMSNSDIASYVPSARDD